jgi:hypothetical protein
MSKLDEAVKGEVIDYIELRPNNAIIHTESGLEIEVWVDQFFLDGVLIKDGGFQVELRRNEHVVERS